MNSEEFEVKNLIDKESNLYNDAKVKTEPSWDDDDGNESDDQQLEYDFNESVDVAKIKRENQLTNAEEIKSSDGNNSYLQENQEYAVLNRLQEKDNFYSIARLFYLYDLDKMIDPDVNERGILSSTEDESFSEEDCSDYSEAEEQDDDDDDDVSLPWIKVYPAEERHEVFPFLARHVGPTNPPPRNSPPIAYFFLFFTQTIWNLMVRETNLYANQCLAKLRDWIKSHPKSRYQNWKNINIITMKKYIGLLINMGLSRRANAVHFWDTRQSQNFPFFRKIMSKNKFLLINRLFHLSNQLHEKKRGEKDFDPWFKVRSLLDSLNSSFKSNYVPEQTLSFDESMIGMRNRTAYIQYMPNKRHCRFGLKKFELCESSTGYVIDIQIYCGKDFIVGPQGLTHTVVFNAMRDSSLLGKGYHVITDSYYTKIPLALDLYQEKTMLSGTINRKSKFFPKLLSQATLKENESVYYRKQCLLACGFKEIKSKKPVYMLTTFGHAEDIRIRTKSGREVVKPFIINEYNLGMGGVDLSDKKIYHLTTTRSSTRYWKKIFDNLLDISLLNAYIIYSKNTEKKRLLSRFDFLVSIVESLCGMENEQQQSSPCRSVLRINDSSTLSSSHSYTLLPRKQLRVCIICSTSEIKHRSRHWCPGCNVGIHERCWPKLKHYYRSRNVLGKKPKVRKILHK